MKAVILAAGMATRLRPLTLNTPKCLLKVGSRSLLQRSMDALIQNGIKEIVIVTGYLEEKIKEFVHNQYCDGINVVFIHNDRYESTNNIYSLWLAKQEADGEEIILLDSDLLYDPTIIEIVLSSSEENVLTLIRHELGEEEMKVVVGTSGNILEINKTCSPTIALGESLGIEKMSKSYTKALYKELEYMMLTEHLESSYYEMAFERLIRQGNTFTVADVSDYFSCELDTVEDFELTQKFFSI